MKKLDNVQTETSVKVFNMNKYILKKTIKQSNFLIEAFQDVLTKRQRDFLYLAFSLAQTGKDKKIKDKIYRMHISQYIQTVGVSGKSHSVYKEIGDMLNDVATKGFRLKGEGIRGRINWFQYAVLRERTGYIEWQLTDQMEGFLVKVEGFFTKMQLQILLGIEKERAQRMYEVIIQWRNLKSQTVTLELDELKRQLGYEKGKYKRYKDFKRRILVPSQKELADDENSRTDMYFDFEEVKKGRKVTAIKFILHKRKVGIVPKEVENKELFRKLIDIFRLKADEAIEIINDLKEEDIEVSLAYTINRIKEGIAGIQPKVKDIRTYTLKAIREGYGIEKQLPLFEGGLKKEEDERREKIKQQQEDYRLEQLYGGFIRSSIDKALDSFPEKKLKELEARAEESAKEEAGNFKDGVKLLKKLHLDTLVREEKNLPTLEEWKEQKSQTIDI